MPGHSGEPKPCTHARRHEHGTRSRYRFDDCRCVPCSLANNAYYAQRYRLVVAGQWAPLVDAGPAAAHVQALVDSGMQRSRIAAQAGVAVSVVSKLLAGQPGARRRRRVRAETAQQLLAVPYPDLDATGTRRRLQALMAIGWPPAALDEQAGEEPGWVERLLEQDLVSSTTAGQAAYLFERLWDCPPPQRTRDEQRAAEQARARAKASGWGPPMAWDVDLNPIDDPAAKPDLGQPVRKRKVPTAEDLLFLIDAGESIEIIAQRAGVRVDTIREAVRKARAAQQLDDKTEAATATQGEAA
jgi:hypothetical protein